MLKTGASLSPPMLVGDMIGGQEYCEDRNKRAEDVSPTLIVRSHVSVPCRLPLRLFPTKGSPNVVLMSITVNNCDEVINFWICGV